MFDMFILSFSFCHIFLLWYFSTLIFSYFHIFLLLYFPTFIFMYFPTFIFTYLHIWHPPGKDLYTPLSNTRATFASLGPPSNSLHHWLKAVNTPSYSWLIHEAASGNEVNQGLSLGYVSPGPPVALSLCPPDRWAPLSCASWTCPDLIQFPPDLGLPASDMCQEPIIVGDRAQSTVIVFVLFVRCSWQLITEKGPGDKGLWLSLVVSCTTQLVVVTSNLPQHQLSPHPTQWFISK